MPRLYGGCAGGGPVRFFATLQRPPSLRALKVFPRKNKEPAIPACAPICAEKNGWKIFAEGKLFRGSALQKNFFYAADILTDIFLTRDKYFILFARRRLKSARLPASSKKFLADTSSRPPQNRKNRCACAIVIKFTRPPKTRAEGGEKKIPLVGFSTSHVRASQDAEFNLGQIKIKLKRTPDFAVFTQ